MSEEVEKFNEALENTESLPNKMFGEESASAEDLPKFNPEEVERESLKQAEEAVQDPIAMAATMYGLYMPKFKQGIKKLSSRARARVLMALIEYPLEEKKYVHSTPFEREMMAVGNAVLEAKFLMILSTYHTAPELQKAMDPNEELTDEEVAEVLGKSPEELLGEYSVEVKENDEAGS